MPYARGESPGKTIAVLKVSITLDPLPAWKAQGESVEFTGRVTRDTEPFPNQTVEIYRAGIKIAEGTTIADGSYRIPWTIPYGLGCRSHSFDAYLPRFDVWSGGRSMAVAYPTRLTISAPDRVAAGEPFTVSGRLTYLDTSPTDEKPLAGRTVKVYYNDSLLGTDVTDSEGNYSVTGSIPSTGSYTLKAVFEGEGLMLPALATLGLTIPGEAAIVLQKAAEYLGVAAPIIATVAVIAADRLTRTR